MLKTTLTVLVTAAACFGIAAATGFASSDKSARTINLKVGDTDRPGVEQLPLPGALEEADRVRRRRTLAGAVSVYYSPHQLNVVQFNEAGNKGDGAVRGQALTRRRAAR